MAAPAESVLKIAVPEAADEARRAAEYRERYGDDVLVVFHLPDGTTCERRVRTRQ